MILGTPETQAWVRAQPESHGVRLCIWE